MLKMQKFMAKVLSFGGLFKLSNSDLTVFVFSCSKSGLRLYYAF